MGLLGALFGAWNSYLVARWLMSDWPMVALFPLMFVVFFSGQSYLILKYGWLAGPFRLHLPHWMVTGGIAAIGAPLLLLLGARTGDRVYAENGLGLAFWGAFPALVALCLLVPAIRRRMRVALDERNEQMIRPDVDGHEQ